jgi:cobalt-precorrin 5A hydrolase
VDRKKEEPGLVAFAAKYNLPFVTFSPEKLQQVEGDFTESDFVQDTIGVGNVCERAAMAACPTGGTLLLPKTAENGVTVAVVKRKWSLRIDEA